MATEVLVPPLGQTVDSVTLVAWHKSEGESVQQGEMLFAIETDKATLDIEAPASGVLHQVTAHPGDMVQVLGAIAVIAEPGETVERRPVEKDAEVAALSTASEGAKKPSRPAGERIFVSPRARRLAEEHGVALTILKPSGPEGAIVERDVRAYLDAQAALEIAPTAYPATAERVARSTATAAHVTLNCEADATALVDLRHRLASDGVDVSYNALLLRVLGRALRDHPRFSASLVGDSVQVWEKVSIGLMVESDQGLLVPVINDVIRKRLAQLEGESRSLIERARLGQCSPQELSGETFILANLGLFGIDSFTPSIHPSECAVLGVGRIRTQQSPSGGLVAARQTMWLSLGFDRRLGDGALAVRFMQRIVQLIEHPYLLLS